MLNRNLKIYGLRAPLVLRDDDDDDDDDDNLAV